MIKRVAEAWRALSNKERAFWDEEARNDKMRQESYDGEYVCHHCRLLLTNQSRDRFVREKAAYKGPWDLPKRRAKKHPLAPKRPMSAFLKYSQTRRNVVKEENPDMANTDVSRLLGEMWRNASPRERAPYVEQEKRERDIYNKTIARWRTEQAELDAASRTSHKSVQQMAGDFPTAASYDEVEARQEEMHRRSSHLPFGYEAHHTEIAAVDSNDSRNSFHGEYRLPIIESYGAQYSSRGHPTAGPG
jgi:hypothetical protein